MDGAWRMYSRSIAWLAGAFIVPLTKLGKWTAAFSVEDT